MTTGRINQVTILKASAGANARSHSQEFVAFRGSFELIRSFKSAGHTARTLDALSPGPMPFTARLVLSLAASVHERSSSGSSKPPPSRLAVSASSVDAFFRALARRATVDSHPIRFGIRLHRVNRYTLSFSLRSGSRGWCARNSSTLDSSQIGRNRSWLKSRSDSARRM